MDSNAKPNPPITSVEPLFDKRILILLLCGIVGLVIFFTKESSAFPNASLDLKTPRAEITAISEKWAAKLGYDKPGRIESTTFNYDDEGKTFLEFELGLNKANDLMRTQIPIWSWYTRLCHEFEQEEMSVTVDTKGKLTGFYHSIENDKALPTLKKDDARAMAQKFVEQEAGLSLANYKLMRDEAVSNLHRTDYSFTWEDQSTEFKGARRRINAGVSGNLLTRFDYYLHVPEEWSRKFSTIRSYNNILASVASIFYYGLHIAAFFIFLWGITKRRIRWRFTLMGAGALTLFDAVEEFNNFASVVAAYDTTTSFKAYIFQTCVSIAAHEVQTLILGLMIFGAAELIYRMSYPENIALENAFSPNGTKSKQVLKGLIAAHAQLGIELGWIVGYYLIGGLFHFWCPLGVENYQVLSTTAPFFSALNLGFKASTTEELIYRVIGLSLAKRVFRNFWLANFFQAAAWAFMHSTYPQQPCYARGVELTISGMFSGWILRKYGVVPCLISHYLLDAFLDCKPLFSSTEPLLSLSALIPLVPFVLMAAFAWWRLKGTPVETEESLKNNAIVQGKTDEEEAGFEEGPEPFEYNPLSSTKRIWLVVSIAVGTIAMACIHTARTLDAKQVSINRQTATSISMTKLQDYLKERKESGDGRMHVAWLVAPPSSDDVQYLFEKVGLKKTMELANITRSGYLWEVRSFKPLDPVEYRYSFDGNGRQVSFDVTKAEDAPGANLVKDAALKLATDYLKQAHPEYMPFDFDNASQVVRKARTDYTFTFKVPKYKVDEAECKIAVSVIGDEVSGFGQGFDIPDKWIWERNKKTLKDDICLNGARVFGVGVALAIFWWMFGVLRSGAVRWRPAIVLAVPYALLALPIELNGLPEYFRYYSNTQPVETFVIKQLIELVNSLMGDFVSLLLLVAFGLGAFRLLYPRVHIAGIVNTIFGRGDKADHRRYWFDGILIGYAYVAIGGLITLAGSLVSAQISPTVPEDVLNPVCSLANVLSPALEFLVDGLKGGVRNVFIMPIMVGLYAKYFRNVKGLAVFTILAILITESNTRYWQDFVVGISALLLTGIVTYFFIARFARKNVLAYFVAGAYPALVERLGVIARHGFQLMVVDVAEIVLIILIPLIYIAVLYLSKDRTEYPTPTATESQPA